MLMFLRKFVLIVICTFFSIILIFAKEQDRWQYSKKVTYENKNELKAIYLDEDIYRHANEDLSDIRLANEKNEFIPYYIYNGFASTNKKEQEEGYKKTKEIDYKVEINKETKETIVKIHNKDRLKINTIMIKTNDEFNRNYQLYQTNKEEDYLEQVARGSIYRLNLEEFQVQDTTVSAEETIDGFLASEYLQMTLDDRDDQPIDIEALEVSYYIDKVVFKTNDIADIHLLFGNQLAKRPDYDIGIYRAEMEKVKQETAILSELVERDVEEILQEKVLHFTWILNICIGLISVLLVILIFRKAPK